MGSDNLTTHIKFFLGPVGLDLGSGHTSSQGGPGILHTHMHHFLDFLASAAEVWVEVLWSQPSGGRLC